MREFAILVQLILIRPANAHAAHTPAIGLIAPGADLHDHIPLPDAAAWVAQHLSGGLALVLPLMAAVMLHVLTRKLPRPHVPALSRGRVATPAACANQLGPGLGHAMKDEHAASAPVI